MRVLDGKYRHRRLLSTDSTRVRPTARRLREALFWALGSSIEGTRFLDLCAGSGAVGIEALSRGAAHVTFVEHTRRMCSVIEMNLEMCGVPEEEAWLVMDDAAGFLRRYQRDGGGGWDIIFFDPPYTADYWPVLRLIGHRPIVSPLDGLLVVEHHWTNELPGRVGQLRRLEILQQGDSCLSFFASKD